MLTVLITSQICDSRLIPRLRDIQTLVTLFGVMMGTLAVLLQQNYVKTS